jgi:hypothetical protein
MRLFGGFNNVAFLHDLISRPSFATVPDMKGNYECVELVVVDSREWVALHLGVGRYLITPNFKKLLTDYLEQSTSELVVAHVVKKLSVFYGTPRFITMFKRTSYWSLF